VARTSRTGAKNGNAAVGHNAFDGRTLSAGKSGAGDRDGCDGSDGSDIADGGPRVVHVGPFRADTSSREPPFTKACHWTGGFAPDWAV